LTGFISIVLAIVLTEISRLAGIAALAYPVYFIHLTVLFFLFASAPYSKMAHMVCRATALVFSNYTGREDKKY
jgi:quinone-modifying oxidoreductase subunit QmoC